MARDGHGLPKVSPGHAMPELSTSCRQVTLKQPSSTPLDDGHPTPKVFPRRYGPLFDLVPILSYPGTAVHNAVALSKSSSRRESSVSLYVNSKSSGGSQTPAWPTGEAVDRGTCVKP